MSQDQTQPKQPTPETDAAIETVTLYCGDEIPILDPGFARRMEEERDAARAVLLKIAEMDYDEGDIWTQSEAMQALAHNAYYHPKS